MEMKKNVGSSDRYVRFLLGIGFILNIFSLETGKLGSFILLALGLVMLFTVFTGYCFMYDILKINTCGIEKKPKQS
jgi:hypothetical protein